LKKLFKDRIDKAYPKELYDKQFSLYVDNIIARMDMQEEAYSKEKNIPDRFFELLNSQRQELLELKEKFGPIVAPEQLEKA
jgi:phosphoenolpyruvate carboxykinase (GTP)